MNNGLKKKLCAAALIGLIISFGGCSTAVNETTEQKQLKEYTSADNSLTISLPGEDWKLDEDSDELRIFSSTDGLVMLTHTENAADELYPEEESELGIILDIEGYSSEGYEVTEFQKTQVGNLRSYQALIHYTQDGAMYKWGVLYGNLIDQEVYMASAMLVADDEDQANVMKSCLQGFVWNVPEDDTEDAKREETTPTPTEEVVVTPQTDQPAEVTPEATPEPTPEATPEPTPEATPEPTPEATPEPTPVPDANGASEAVTPANRTGYCHSSAYVRSEPNNQSTVLGTMEEGTEFAITGEVRNWYQISYNGGTAYICKDYIQ